MHLPFRHRLLDCMHNWRVAVAVSALAVTGDGVCALRQVPLPWSVAALNLLAFVCVCLAGWRARQSISLEPDQLASQMLQVQENERQHLSRELHDDIGQMLTAAKLQFDWLLRRLPEQQVVDAATLGAILDETLGKVRDVSALLNPRQLGSLGLEASLRAHLLRSFATTDISWSLDCQQRLDGIPADMTMAAFRIAQEAITNLLRHAQAHNVSVRLQRTPQGLRISIEDDGKGFTPPAPDARAAHRGLSGMHERALLLGGELQVDSSPGHGTRIHALLPWPPRTRERAGLGSVERP